MNRIKLFPYIAVLFIGVSLLVSSCSDDEIVPADPSIQDEAETIFTDGYSLTFSTFLDNMGGIESRAGENPMEEIENYIDEEKIRVFFFDSDDKFLFESKSRWVKKTEDKKWLISVPLYTSGNDRNDDWEWDWEAIRTKLTSGKFKIAIRANYPLQEWYPGFSNTSQNFNGGGTAEWIDNQGPYWTNVNSSVYSGVGADVKDIFDFHHCQYDKLYKAKAEETGYYRFIMGDWGDGVSDDWRANYSSDKPTLSATASWVNWNQTIPANQHTPHEANTSSSNNSNARHFILPSYEHPIPMYGVQEYDQISADTWLPGSSYPLNRPSDKSIFLLRSVVKLELKIPKRSNNTTIQRPRFVAIPYPNIYSRCEPINNWTPTDILWNEQHTNNNANCEITAIRNYGGLTMPRTNNINRFKGKQASGDVLVDFENVITNKDGNYKTSDNDYMELLSWFYGSWKQKNWPFRGFTGNFGTEAQYGNYPQIFNPCIQRNTIVFADYETDLTDDYDDEYYHYVVYTGERNVLDQSDLGYLTSNSSGQPTVSYWFFEINNQHYAVPITDDNPDITIVDYNGSNTNHVWINGRNINNGKYWDSSDIQHEYGDTIVVVGYSQRVQNKEFAPWPLIRNHVYTLTLTRRGSRSGDGSMIFGVKPEDNYSKYVESK